MTRRRDKVAPKFRGCSSLNSKCDRTDCVYGTHTSYGIFCGYYKRVVTAVDIKNCTHSKDRFS